VSCINQVDEGADRWPLYHGGLIDSRTKLVMAQDDDGKTDAINRFCREYLQLERDLDFPAGPLLRREDVQAALFERLFAEGALKYFPPPRYQLRVLKSLVSKIESSIDDWDEHVRPACCHRPSPGSKLHVHRLTPLPGSFGRFDECLFGAHC
jgi:hypothetical protein